MRFTDDYLTTMLLGVDNTRLIYLAKVPFDGRTVYIHSGIGEKIHDGDTYIGIGNMGEFSGLKEDGRGSASRLSLTLRFEDPIAFNEVMNANPMGNEVEIYIAALNENRRIESVELLAAGDIVDYNVKRGKPYFIKLAVSDWFEIWAKANNAAKYTNASQQIHYPTDQFFSMVEEIAKGIDDTIPGKEIGGSFSGGARGTGGRSNNNRMMRH